MSESKAGTKCRIPEYCLFLFVSARGFLFRMTCQLLCNIKNTAFTFCAELFTLVLNVGGRTSAFSFPKDLAVSTCTE
jgi:hypothetical protein